MTPSFSQILTTTLLHFVWQGTLIGLAYAAIKQQTRSPQIRYGVGVGALALSILWPTWTLLSALFSASATPLAVAQPGILPTPTDSPLLSAAVANAISWLWCSGATLFSLRTAGSVLYLRFRVLADRVEPSPALRETVQHLANPIGLKRVRLWTSKQVDVPQVVGFFRPVVLVPLAMLRRLSPPQLEAVLLHELVHLRRRDPLIQALQTLAESLLFYHPAVWWLSSQIRHEREFCCDEEVIQRTGHRLAYAQALLALETQRTPATPALAINGGSLMNRIRRIVDPEISKTRTASRPTAALVGLLLATLAVTTLVASGPGRDDSGPIAWMPSEVRQWEGLLEDAGRKHQVDPALLSIIAFVESRGDAKAVSSGGARGLMQIMPSTGKQIAEAQGHEDFDADQLMDPALSADYAAFLLADYLDRFENSDDPAWTIEWAAAAYNGG